ncbi:MAG: hypothetical protein JST82_00940 [Bacteroidetes bacterium]|nr:hypothetical protein [Bacteroidota bacterium]
MKRFCLYGFSLCLMLFTVNCNKKRGDVSTTPISNNSIHIDFTITGNQWAYQTLKFHSANIPDTTDIKWDFGDSTSATYSSYSDATHLY